MRELPLDVVAPEAPRVRLLVAALLQAAGRALEALARRLALVELPAQPAEPHLEFYGDAAAPEGALYVNGQLVGHVLGVKRL
jgi:hypothetical protein